MKGTDTFIRSLGIHTKSGLGTLMPHTVSHWNLTFVHVQYGKGYEKALGDDIPSVFINGLFDGHGLITITIFGFDFDFRRRWLFGKGGEEPGDGALYRVFPDPAVDF